MTRQLLHKRGWDTIRTDGTEYAVLWNPKDDTGVAGIAIWDGEIFNIFSSLEADWEALARKLWAAECNAWRGHAAAMASAWAI